MDLDGCFIGACTTAEEELILAGMLLEVGLREGTVCVRFPEFLCIFSCCYSYKSHLCCYYLGVLCFNHVILGKVPVAKGTRRVTPGSEIIAKKLRDLGLLDAYEVIYIYNEENDIDGLVVAQIYLDIVY